MGRLPVTAAATEESRNVSQLVVSAQSGDHKAMAALIEFFQERLYRFCVYLAGQPHLAQDLAQATLVSVLENIKKVHEPARFQSWLFTSAKNLYLDHLRRADNAEYTPIEEATSLVADTRDCAKIIGVQRALAELEPEDRAMLLLIDMEGASYSEAAAALGMKESSVASRLSRIRESFMRNYK